MVSILMAIRQVVRYVGRVVRVSDITIIQFGANR